MLIEELCKEYTDLNEEEIETIKVAQKSLAAMANLFNVDAFIDCPMSDGSGDSIVVAEAKPIDGVSSYKRPVVGLVATKEKEPAVYRTFQLKIPTKFMKATTQENTHVVQTTEPIFCKDRIIGVFIIEQRIEQVYKERDSERINNIDKKVESRVMDEPRCDEILLGVEKDSVVDTLEEGVMFINNDNRVVFRNKAAKNIYERLGFIGEILGKDYKEICIVSPTVMNSSENVVAQEVRVGNYYFNVRTLNIRRKDVDFIVTLADITDKKIQEQALILKSVAFREMHHRVKNNLQTIAGLMRLQRNKAESNLTKQALNETISRILAISSTHQLLMEKEFEVVTLIDIIASVMENAKLYSGREDFELEIENHGGDFDIKFEKATALALILNELIQNSIKYAFPNKSKGRIVIMTLQRRANEVELIFSDNGCGFDTSKVSSGSMGWTIIDSMVKEKLKGHWKLKSSNQGTKVKIVFNI